MKRVVFYFINAIFFLTGKTIFAQYGNFSIADKYVDSRAFSPSAKPWVIWYWLHGAVSREGITADLEAMKQVGIGGAYLMTIKDTTSTLPFKPQARQLTTEWWGLVKYALEEAKRLQLEIGVHVSDGFALAGGPWVKPEMSMQKLVWTKTFVSSGQLTPIMLPKPTANQNYYKDVAVFAYPANYKNEFARGTLKPIVTTSTDSAASFLADESQQKTFRSDVDCWIQYTYPKSVTIRQVRIKKQSNAYQSQRFIIETSNDGNHFVSVDTLHPPRHGWQDWDEGYTHAIKTITTRYIRFVWKKDGTEPGSEDLDAAKWKPVLKVQGIYVSDEPVINNIEAKNGSMWRVGLRTTVDEITGSDAVPLSKIINVTNKMSVDGSLNWQPPLKGDWVVVRIGHTSTGYMNTTAGGGKGLECDKLSKEAAVLQFDNWFNKFYQVVSPDVAKDVIKVFHMDSWECGSQNWTYNFINEFNKRRGYDLLPFLVVMTGIPVNSAKASEQVLRDVRQTIAELVCDNFYGTFKKLAHDKGCTFSAESIAPTFVSDGLLHYKNVDLPMGEFWVNSPTHDKPNDMFDAISGAHIYGKRIVGAEAYTTLRTDWSEYPGSLKALGDRAFAEGINKLTLHVFMQSPWVDKKPGITLDGIGMFYQRGQTWFDQSKAWIEYITRCQEVLQKGKPVVDIAVFTGEEIPGRSILPDKLVNILPGIFGQKKVDEEKRRIANAGQPMKEMPTGVSSSANTYDPQQFINALRGYKYDCFNRDVLMNLYVKNGLVHTPNGSVYKLLIIPAKHPMNPSGYMSAEVKNKILQMQKAGAKIITDETKLLKRKNVIKVPYTDSSFAAIDIERDVDVIAGAESNAIAWTHRQVGDTAIYFISNQTNKYMTPTISFRIDGWKPEIYDAVGNQIFPLHIGRYVNNRTILKLIMEPYQSCFIVFREKARVHHFAYDDIPCAGLYESLDLNKDWNIVFNNESTGEKKMFTFDSLESWTLSKNDFIKYYSGTAVYKKSFTWNQGLTNNYIRLHIDSLWNIATVRLNGVDCGTLWTPPYSLNISSALKKGENIIEIEVTNTWRNKMVWEAKQPADKRTLWHNNPFSMENKPLLPAGIKGVSIIY